MSMPESNREPIVELLERQFDNIFGLASSLRDDQFQLATECPGWTVFDQVAHIVATELSLLGQSALSKKPEKLPPHVKNPIGEFNEIWLIWLREKSNEQLLELYKDTTTKRIKALKEMGREEFDKIGWSPIGQVPYRDFMKIRLFDCWVHEIDIRFATKVFSLLDFNISKICLEHIKKSLAKITAKKADFNNGETVLFKITNHPDADFGIKLRENRAYLLETLENISPTCSITVSLENLVRLSCGRIGFENLKNEITLAGDSEKASLLLANSNFMI